jgi:hypothetical protein
MSRTFYAIATGQNQANLPPILTLADPRQDHVVWLETPEARKRGWVEGSWLVLKATRQIEQARLEVDDETIQSPVCFERWLRERIKGVDDPVFVLNGGLKQHTLGLDRAALAAGNVTLVYSDLKPAALRILDPGAEAFRTEPLGNCLHMGEFLRLNGFEPKNTTTRIWPGISAFRPSEFLAFRTRSDVQQLVMLLYGRLMRDTGATSKLRKLPPLTQAQQAGLAEPTRPADAAGILLVATPLQEDGRILPAPF